MRERERERGWSQRQPKKGEVKTLEFCVPVSGLGRRVTLRFVGTTNLPFHEKKDVASCF